MKLAQGPGVNLKIHFIVNLLTQEREKRKVIKMYILGIFSNKIKI